MKALDFFAILRRKQVCILDEWRCLQTGFRSGVKQGCYDLSFSIGWLRTGSLLTWILWTRRWSPWIVTERILYYSTFQIHNQVDAGRDSYAFCPVYVISILDFNIDENRGNPDVKTVYRLYEEGKFIWSWGSSIRRSKIWMAMCWKAFIFAWRTCIVLMNVRMCLSMEFSRGCLIYPNW